MTTGIRWRIFVLQIGLIGILGFVSGFAFWASGFPTGQVHDQLVAQQIVFPTTASTAFTALPAADQTAMAAYAGQTMTTGPQAETYADHFIAVHLDEIGQGKTYSQFPATGLTPAQTATKTALFQGETLRGLLSTRTAGHRWAHTRATPRSGSPWPRSRCSSHSLSRS